MRKEWRGHIQKREDGSELVNYTNDDFPAYIHTGYVLPGVTWVDVAHCHTDFEFITILEGEMGYSINGTTITLQAGDTLMVNSDQIHYSIATQPDICRYIIIIFHPSILCSSFSVQEKFIDPVINHQRLHYLLFSAESNFAKQLFLLSQEITTHVHDIFRITKELFDIWTIVLDYCMSENELHGTEHYNPSLSSMKKMMTFCHNYYHQKVTLKDIARYANVSETYCNQLFHKYTNRSPIEYLTKIRTDKAAELLVYSHLSMSDIAEQTGFSGASYFAETFKKMYLMSPREYRKRKTPET